MDKIGRLKTVAERHHTSYIKIAVGKENVHTVYYMLPGLVSGFRVQSIHCTAINYITLLQIKTVDSIVIEIHMRHGHSNMVLRQPHDGLKCALCKWD